MRIEDLKAGMKLQVIKTYRGNGIVLREGEIIEITKQDKKYYVVKTPGYYEPIIVPYDILLDCCRKVEILLNNNKENLTNEWNIRKSKDYYFKDMTSAANKINIVKKNLKTDNKTSKAYKVETTLTFNDKKYTVGDFVRIKVENMNVYGKIIVLNKTSIELVKLSSDKHRYTVYLDYIIDMENIG